MDALGVVVFKPFIWGLPNPKWVVVILIINCPVNPFNISIPPRTLLRDEVMRSIP
jgi:hypothetical protein